MYLATSKMSGNKKAASAGGPFWNRPEVDLKEVISKSFYFDLSAHLFACIFVFFMSFLLYGFISPYHNLPPYYDSSTNSTMPSVQLAQQYISHSHQCLYFVTVLVVKIMAWEMCFPSAISSLFVRKYVKYALLFLVSISCSFVVFISNHLEWTPNTPFLVFVAVALMTCFNVILPALVPHINYLDMHRILRYCSLIFLLYFVFFIPLKWFHLHSYHMRILGEDRSEYNYAWKYGTFIFLLTILVQLIETISSYYVKKEIPKLDPIPTFTILLITSMVLFCTSSLTAFHAERVDFCAIDPTCPKKLTGNASEITTTTPRWSEGETCWWERETVISREKFVDMFKSGPGRLQLYQYLTVKFPTYIHKPYEVLHPDPKPVYLYPFLVSVIWAPCDIKPGKVMRSQHYQHIGIVEDTDRIHLTSWAFDSEWRFLVDHGYRTKPFKVWVIQRERIYEIAPDKVYNCRQLYHYMYQREFFSSDNNLHAYILHSMFKKQYTTRSTWQYTIEYTTGGFTIYYTFFAHTATRMITADRIDTHQEQTQQGVYNFLGPENYRGFDMPDQATVYTLQAGLRQLIANYQKLKLLTQRACQDLLGKQHLYSKIDDTFIYCAKTWDGTPCKGATGSILLYNKDDRPYSFGFLLPIISESDSDVCFFFRYGVKIIEHFFWSDDWETPIQCGSVIY